MTSYFVTGINYGLVAAGAVCGFALFAAVLTAFAALVGWFISLSEREDEDE